MPEKFPKTSRIEAFSDGVIAIVLTIMVLELKVPEHVGDQGIGLDLLTSLLPKLVPYIMSFIVIAIMWVNHHRLLDAAHRADNTVLWANIHLLFWMTLIPISTAFVGEHLFEPVAIAAYGFLLTGSSTAFTLLRWCVTRDERGQLSALHAASVKKSVIATAIYGASIPLAYVSVYLSMAIFVILPALFVLPDFLLPRWAVNAPEKRRR
jgi:TMEM175 potassium channel family protein